MTISDELREYVNRYVCTTGHRPSAMPITHEEGRRLWMEWKDCLMVPAGEDAIPSFLGVDLYVTPDAKQRRELIKAKA